MENQLYHHGIKGMKWGVRKRKYYNKDGSLNTTGKQRELRKTYKAERKAAANKAERKAAANKYQKAVKDTYHKNYNDLDRIFDTYNIGTRGVNRINDRMLAGESHQKAYRKEYGIAIAKSTAAAAAFLAAPYIMNATVDGIRKYANQKAIQRANAGLARIGTFQYEKVAKNVYRQVMK